MAIGTAIFEMPAVPRGKRHPCGEETLNASGTNKARFDTPPTSLSLTLARACVTLCFSHSQSRFSHSSGPRLLPAHDNLPHNVTAAQPCR